MVLHFTSCIYNIFDLNNHLIFNRQKELLVVVKDVFSNSIHGHCAFHLKSIIKQTFG